MNRPPVPPQHTPFLAADTNPQDPQFSHQDHFLGALMRLLFLKIAEELSPAELEQFMTLEPDNPAAFHALHAHNEARWERLQQKHRNGGQQAPAPAAPAGKSRYYKSDGRPDLVASAGQEARALFEQALGR